MNKCDGCTACCTAFEVKWLKKPGFTECKYCDKGCTIQDTKDDECRQFDCAYIQSNVKNINMRPDKCGVIYEKISDDIFYGLLDHNRTEFPDLRGQVSSFISQGISVVLFHKNKGLKAVAVNGDEDTVVKRYKEIVGKTNGIHM